MAARTIRTKIGRQRITKVTSPIEASYVRSIRAQMRGIEENLSALIQELKDVTPAVLEDTLRPTFEKAFKFTPVATGALRKSGFLEVQPQGKRIQAEMGFGRGSVPPYTVFVHERTDLNHVAPTKAKFLQTALEEDSDAIPRRLEKAYREKVGFDG